MSDLTDEEIEALIKRAGLANPNARYSGRTGQEIASEAIARLLALNYRAMVKQDSLNKLALWIAILLGIGELILAYLAFVK